MSQPYSTERRRLASQRGRSVEERFWALVDRRGSDECWPWLGVRTAGGYGRLSINGTKVPATRYSLELKLGRSPVGDACHTCDNPPCVNPGHLFEGSRQVNLADSSAKGRMHQGERHPRTPFTADQIREIRARYAAGGISHSQLAEAYGVGRRSIGKIIDGTNWGHLE